MSIRGYYMKDNTVTEIVTDHVTLEAPKRELQVFTFPKRKHKPRRLVNGLSLPNAIALGLAVGSTLGALMIAASATEGTVRGLVIATIVYNAIFFYENALRKR